MGRNKALLELAGRPLVELAVTKLRRLCAEVAILSGDAELAGYGPLVADVHPECGPMGGIEAALLRSKYAWNLILPVDVPFLPTAYLDMWMRATLRAPVGVLRLAMIEVDGVPQPTLLIVHQDVRPYLTASLEQGAYKLLPALESAAEQMAAKGGVEVAQVFERTEREDIFAPRFARADEAWRRLTKAQRDQRLDWFANLNTPEEFAEAERFAAVLDT